MSFRLAASLAAAALLCACSAPKAASTGSAGTAAPTATASLRPAPGPANSLVSAAGRPDAVRLDAAERRELDRAVAKVPAALRPRLRYALASADDGRRRLVVYDGEGLRADGRQPGKNNAYVVFRVLNAAGGEHYDPQQNALVAPLPPPQRETSPSTY